MDKLLTTHLGGIKHSKNQERFQIDAIRSALEFLMQGLLEGKDIGLVCRLWGCQITEDANNINVTEGAVIINAEVCFVPAHTCPKNQGKKQIWDVNNFSLASEQSTDLNGVKFDLKQYRQAHVREIDPADNYYLGKLLYDGIKDFYDFVARKSAIDSFISKKDKVLILQKDYGALDNVIGSDTLWKPAQADCIDRYNLYDENTGEITLPAGLYKISIYGIAEGPYKFNTEEINAGFPAVWQNYGLTIFRELLAGVYTITHQHEKGHPKVVIEKLD